MSGRLWAGAIAFGLGGMFVWFLQVASSGATGGSATPNDFVLFFWAMAVVFGVSARLASSD